MEILTKLRPDRDLQCYFERPSAVAALSGSSSTQFTLSGVFRQQSDWAVLEWNRDNVFEHPAFRPLPDGDFRGVRLSYDEERTNCMLWDSTLWPTVDWPYLRIWATESDGIEREYKVPIPGMPINPCYASAQASFTLVGTPVTGDCIEVAWEAGDGVSPSLRHATHSLFYDQTVEDGLQILAAAINEGADESGMTAEANGATITLRYRQDKGANGNRVGVYCNAKGKGSLEWAPSLQAMTGGVSPNSVHIDLDFSSLQGYEGPEFKNRVPVPTGNIRRMRWTWAPSQSSGEFVANEFAVRVTNWTVSGSGIQYDIAGPASWRVEDDSDALTYNGNWTRGLRGNYSGGSIALSAQFGSSVSYSYFCGMPHRLYLGTRRFHSEKDGASRIAIQVDGTTCSQNLAVQGQEDILVRMSLGELGIGQHTVTVTQEGPGAFYFDFFEVAVPVRQLPTFPSCPDTTLATDWDTDHSLALAPERTAWLTDRLGFHGRANHYAGAMWFYELCRPGHRYASASITFDGEPEFGTLTTLTVGSAAFVHLTLAGDTANSVATALALAVNAGATAVRAEAADGTLILHSRVMGAAGNGLPVSLETNSTLQFNVSGPLAGGSDGDVESLPWAKGWRTDTSARPALNRAARDWHRSYCTALRQLGIAPTVAFSMELHHGDPGPDAGLAQRFPNGSPAIVSTPAVQTNFSPASTAFWCTVYAEMADIMTESGATPSLQLGEVQWWYFPTESGMPFYDAYTRERFRADYGRPMEVITSQYQDPGLFQDEAEHLARLIGDFTEAVISSVLERQPTAEFEVLYAPDVNDAPLTKAVNFPSATWNSSRLSSLKTENFTYTCNRDLNKVASSLQVGSDSGFPRARRTHLIGISDDSTPWRKERRLALEVCSSVVLFALDQFCLIGYPLPLDQSARRSILMAAPD